MDDNINYKSISCEQIPEIFLDKLVAKKHFSKFGKINRFILRPKRLSCTVEYENEEDAERACMEAGNYNGYEFLITYAEHEVGHVQNTEEWVGDPDVQAELDIMSSRPNSSSFGRQPSTASIFGLSSASTSKPSSQMARMPKPTQTTTATKLPKISDTQRNELETLMRSPAHTIEEKYFVLDARDKLIRLTTVRQTDINKAKRTQGFCPDMCPEKERLLRAFQRQVSSFEQVVDSDGSTTISHDRAIKEYSRSSADQEVPLEHELRSEKVLKMTMLYLMHHVMDLCNDPQISLGDWFHFVWDRTRSIRKDITQQELCSLSAVELVEQCARFHIHCAARLVAEDPIVFDKKINAENLTKCLQTLKYMYHDLRLKGVHCPCETEFRSYIVLLNLGDSNFLWELKQLPEDIQKSQKIKQAIAFCNALQTNNFVRFFQMIRSPETSYLSACILLGYFNKLRLRALEAINKSHNWRKNDVFLPLEYLAKILGFEDTYSATYFFEYHGLQCDEERVMLNRLSTPDIEYSMERAVNLVESKLTTSIGECICGHPLESWSTYANHKPHNSFDENGMLRADAWAAEDQMGGKAPPLGASTAVQPVDDNIFKVPKPSALPSKSSSPFGDGTSTASIAGTSLFKLPKKSEPAPTMPPAPSPITFGKPPPSQFGSGNVFGSTTTASASTTNLFGNSVIKTKSPSLELPTSFRKDNIFRFYEDAGSDVTGTSAATFGKNASAVPSVADQADQRAKQQQREKEARERIEAEARMRALEQEQALKQKQLEAEQRKLRELQEQQARLRAEQEREKLRQERESLLYDMEQKAEKATDALIDEWVMEQVRRIADEQLLIYKSLQECAEALAKDIEDEVVEDEIRDIALSEFRRTCTEEILLRRYFQRWLQQSRTRVKQRRLLETLSPWVGTEVPREILHTSQMENLQMIKRYRHGEPCDFRKLLWDETGGDAVRLVNIFEVIRDHYSPRSRNSYLNLQTRKYFKLLVSIPTDNDELPGFGSLCNKWLKKYVYQPPNPQPIDGAFLCGMEQNVAVCVRKVSGLFPHNERGELVTQECDNADGILCLISCVNLKHTSQRISNMLRLASAHKPLPLAIVVYSTQYDEKQLMEELGFCSLQEKHFMSEFSFFGYPKDKNQFHFLTYFRRAIAFVAKNANACIVAHQLEMQYLPSWLDTCLGEEMWQRWAKSINENPAFAKFCCQPQLVVQLYNEALRHLETIAGADMHEAPSFPSELRPFVPKERLDMVLGLEYFPEDWKNARRQRKLCCFLENLRLPKMIVDESTLQPTVESVELLLLNYACLCIPNNDMKATKAAYLAINCFIEQLESEELSDLLLEHRFKYLNYLLILKPIVQTALYDHWESMNQLPRELIYPHQLLIDYLEQPWWLQMEAVSAFTVDYTMPDAVDELSTTHDETDEFDVTVAHAEKVLQVAETELEDSTATVTAVETEASRLLQKLNQKMHHVEAAIESGVYNLPIASEDVPPVAADAERRKHKTTKQVSEAGRSDDDGPGNSKRFKSENSQRNEQEEVIANAMSIIKKLEALEDEELQARERSRITF